MNNQVNLTENLPALEKKSTPRRRLLWAVFNLVLVILYVIIGWGIHDAILGPLQGTDEQQGFQSIEVTSQLAGTAFACALIVVAVKRFLLKSRKGRVLPIILMLGLLLSVPTFLSEKTDSDSDRMLGELLKNQLAEQAILAHGQRAGHELLASHYPALVNPLLDQPLSANPTLEDLQKRRDAYKDALLAAQDIPADFPRLLDAALVKDDQTLQSDVTALHIVSSIPPKFFPIVDGSLEKGAVPSSLAQFSALARKLEASKLLVDYLIDTYGRWHRDAQGKLIFDLQSDLDRFNKLATAEQHAVDELAARQSATIEKMKAAGFTN